MLSGGQVMWNRLDILDSETAISETSGAASHDWAAMMQLAFTTNSRTSGDWSLWDPILLFEMPRSVIDAVDFPLSCVSKLY